MSELRTLLSETTARVLTDSRGAALERAWSQIAQAGLASVLIREEDGGFGGTWSDAMIVVKAAGQYACAAPLPENIMATALAHAGSVAMPDGMITIGPRPDGALNGTNFTGSIAGAPWGRNASHVATIVAHGGGHQLVIARVADAKITPHENPAGEPRDTLLFDQAPVVAAEIAGWDIHRLYTCGAMLRSAQIAGAIAGALELSVTYTRERQQFGRPLANFQAIQQQLAVLAEETAASDMAAAAAFRAADTGEGLFECAAAKLRTNRAARTATGIAHQVHGAMGFTAEYDLHHFTRRLWAWQTEFGNERFWGGKIGSGVAARGPANFWADLVALSE